jgi:hypothetical protein
MRFSEPTDSAFLRVFSFVIVFLGGVVCGNCWGGIARAQPELEATATQRALALDVARTTVNEASLSAQPNDVRLTYEATRGHGNDDATRLRWLRRHSRCTNPRGDCDRNGVVDELDDDAAARRPGNARWTRQLRWNDARPRNLVGRWRAEWWARVRELALRLVLADEPTNVCGIPIRTWGRRSDFDSRPGLVRVDCGAANFGGTTPAIIRRHRGARRARLALADDPS